MISIKMSSINNKLKEFFGNDNNLSETIEIDTNDNMNETIDINDYDIDKDDKEYENFINLINIFTCYYKQLYETNQDFTMFDNIDYEKNDSTNRCMEFLYEEIFKFKISNENDKETLYSPDCNLKMEDCKELYTLYIENEPKYLCKYLLPILQHLSIINWLNIKWSIIPIKK